MGKNRANKKIGLKRGLRTGVVKKRPRQCGEQSKAFWHPEYCRMSRVLQESELPQL